MPGMISVPSKARFSGRAKGSSWNRAPHLISGVALGLLAIVALLNVCFD